VDTHGPHELHGPQEFAQHLLGGAFGVVVVGEFGDFVD
jgi:hypothetical protein